MAATADGREQRGPRLTLLRSGVHLEKARWVLLG